MFLKIIKTKLFSAIVFMIYIAILVVFIKSDNPAPTSREQTRTHQPSPTKTDKNSNYSNCCSQTTLLNLELSKGKKPTADNQTQNVDNSSSDNDIIKNASIISIITAVFMTIFTFFLVSYNKKMWEAMHRSVQIAEKSADAATISAKALTESERAFLHITICSDNIKEATPIHHVKYQIRNYGKTPGILREVSHSIKWGKEFHGTQHYLPMDVIGKERIVSANSSTENITCAVNDSKDFVKNVEIFRRELCAWFYGRIVYDDIFGNTHEHRFLWKSSINTKTFFPCYDTAYKQYNINT